MSATPSPCAEREDDLALLAGGDLEPREARAVEAHVQSCAACARALAELRDTVTWARTRTQPTLPAPDLAELERRVLAQVEAAPVPLRRPRVAQFAAVSLLAAAAAVALVLSRAGGIAPTPPGEPARVAPAALSEALSEGEEDDDEADALWAAVEDDEPTPPSHPLKIELRTTEPGVRIVWLAN
jgi:anti-sigma factor RsiW